MSHDTEMYRAEIVRLAREERERAAERPVDPAVPAIGARVQRLHDQRWGTVRGHRGGRDLDVEWDPAPWDPDAWRRIANADELAADAERREPPGQQSLL